ncbi:MAG: hypothetical protein SPE82_01935 [Succinivibrio sp.]|nr:hypothetical protein [Succinivibrio sp.]
MKVVPFNDRYKQDFIELNKAWSSSTFVIADEDLMELSNIELYLKNGDRSSL